MTRIPLLLLLVVACTGDEASTPPPAAAGDSATTDTGGAWRSTLYPEDWAPGFTVDDHALHDLSFAGYRNGEASLPYPAPGVS